jgi:hypothetical protein
MKLNTIGSIYEIVLGHASLMSCETINLVFTFDEVRQRATDQERTPTASFISKNALFVTPEMPGAFLNVPAHAHVVTMDPQFALATARTGVSVNVIDLSTCTDIEVHTACIPELLERKEVDIRDWIHANLYKELVSVETFLLHLKRSARATLSSHEFVDNINVRSLTHVRAPLPSIPKHVDLSPSRHTHFDTYLFQCDITFRFLTPIDVSDMFRRMSATFECPRIRHRGHVKMFSELYQYMDNNTPHINSPDVMDIAYTYSKHSSYYNKKLRLTHSIRDACNSVDFTGRVHYVFAFGSLLVSSHSIRCLDIAHCNDVPMLAQMIQRLHPTTPVFQSVTRCSYAMFVRHVVRPCWFYWALRLIPGVTIDETSGLLSELPVPAAPITVNGVHMSISLISTTHSDIIRAFSKNVEFEQKSVVMVTNVDHHTDISIVETLVSHIIRKCRSFDVQYGNIVTAVLGPPIVVASDRVQHYIDKHGQPVLGSDISSLNRHCNRNRPCKVISEEEYLAFESDKLLAWARKEGLVSATVNDIKKVLRSRKIDLIQVVRTAIKYPDGRYRMYVGDAKDVMFTVRTSAKLDRSVVTLGTSSYNTTKQGGVYILNHATDPGTLYTPDLPFDYFHMYRDTKASIYLVSGGHCKYAFLRTVMMALRNAPGLKKRTYETRMTTKERGDIDFTEDVLKEVEQEIIMFQEKPDLPFQTCLYDNPCLTEDLLRTRFNDPDKGITARNFTRLLEEVLHVNIYVQDIVKKDVVALGGHNAQRSKAKRTDIDMCPPGPTQPRGTSHFGWSNHGVVWEHRSDWPTVFVFVNHIASFVGNQDDSQRQYAYLYSDTLRCSSFRDDDVVVQHTLSMRMHKFPSSISPPPSSNGPPDAQIIHRHVACAYRYPSPVNPDVSLWVSVLMPIRAHIPIDPLRPDAMPAWKDVVNLVTHVHSIDIRYDIIYGLTTEIGHVIVRPEPVPPDLPSWPRHTPAAIVHEWDSRLDNHHKSIPFTFDHSVEDLSLIPSPSPTAWHVHTNVFESHIL